MSAFRVTPSAQHIQSAYDRALVFDRMKKKSEEERAAESASKIDTVVKDSYKDVTTTSSYLPVDKPKPNTVPFKPGFVFEYGRGTEGGGVTVTITDVDRVKIEMESNAMTDDRKKAVKSLVMLGLGKINREDLNKATSDGRQSVETIKKELSYMGLKSDIPFGLGEDSFYFDFANLLRQYKSIDVNG